MQLHRSLTQLLRRALAHRTLIQSRMNASTALSCSSTAAVSFSPVAAPSPGSSVTSPSAPLALQPSFAAISDIRMSGCFLAKSLARFPSLACFFVVFPLV